MKVFVIVFKGRSTDKAVRVFSTQEAMQDAWDALEIRADSKHDFDQENSSLIGEVIVDSDSYSWEE